MADAWARGATEVCMQGGINPDMPPFKYRDLLDVIKSAFPAMHIHAFSPMEIMYGARRTKMAYPEYIGMLREHGLGSIPGTAAEILDDSVREILSHKKVDVAAWVEIVTTAHSLGVPSTSTIMYGHVESPHHIVNHHQPAARHSKAHPRLHRIRAPALHPSEYPAVPQGAGGAAAAQRLPKTSACTPSRGCFCAA